MNDPDKLIEKLNMKPHPEGGYFSESFRDKDNKISLIYYLLKKNQCSHWHRLKNNEILHFYQGDPLYVYISKDSKTSITKILGKNIYSGQHIHLIVKARSWFSMETKGEFSLIGCTVAPAFDYSDFELAPPKWMPTKKK
jgi:hypothetical protein